MGYSIEETELRKAKGRPSADQTPAWNGSAPKLQHSRFSAPIPAPASACSARGASQTKKLDEKSTKCLSKISRFRIPAGHRKLYGVLLMPSLPLLHFVVGFFVVQIRGCWPADPSSLLREVAPSNSLKAQQHQTRRDKERRDKTKKGKTNKKTR